MSTSQTKHPFGVYQVKISGNELNIEPVYQDIMTIVKLNHCLDDRIKILTLLGFRLLFIHRSGYGLEINQGLIKMTHAKIGTVGSSNFDQASFTCYPTESKPTHQKSYYIQISGSTVRHKYLPGNRVTIFIEITENELLKLTRKAKLEQLFG